MKTIRQLGSMMVRTAIAFSLLFGMGVRSDAQEKTSAQKSSGSTEKLPAAPPSQTAGAEKPSAGPQEGIKVHGDWTIVIRNQDGTVVSRHEFKNALSNFAVLPQILAHGGGVGRWEVDVDGVNGTHPCAGTNPIAGTIPIFCPLTETSGPPTFGSLSVTASATNLTLRGSIQVAFAVQLGVVTTNFDLCVPPQTPSATCLTPNRTGPLGFTGKDISSLNIQVVANQTIDVTVVISFS